jgi:hypothetical protein
MSEADECRYLAAWAERYGASLQLDGEVGFGRACVGVIKDNTYPGYREGEQLNAEPYWRLIHECPEAAPPEGVENAYHKHDCLAVLGRGADAVHQLYLWVCHLEAQGIGIATIPRRPAHEWDAIFQGLSVPVLTKLAESEPGLVTLIDPDEMRRRGPGFGER